MNRIVPFVRALTRHPKTSAAGLTSIVGVIVTAIARPEILAEPSAWVAILTGIGLLFAGDGRDDDRGGGPPRIPADAAYLGREARKLGGKDLYRSKVVEMPSRLEVPRSGGRINWMQCG